MIYIFDIDGTLADLSDRLHHIQKKPQDWAGFFADCSNDKPIEDVIEVLQALHLRANRIFLITGRSDEIEEKTMEWLRLNDIEYEAMYMRKAGDHREDNVVKSELLDNLLEDWKELLEDHQIGGVFEDRQQVVDMYRARGLRVFQVAPRNF